MTLLTGISYFRRSYGQIALILLLAVFLGVSACGSNHVTESFTPPFQQSIFAQSVPGTFTQPDSIVVNAQNIFIGYGNGVAKDGSDGKSSTIVEYTMSGKLVQSFSVLGHNDGLKIDPSTSLLWALQNEDGNPSLVTINPVNGTMTTYTFAPTAHGGGYDDIVFAGGTVFMSASAPASNPNTAPAIVSVTLSGTQANVSPVMAGNASATDIPSGNTLTLNLQDPDSMILDPNGNLVLDSQDDAELIIVINPGSGSQAVKHLGLTSSGAAVKVDDTVFATSTSGMILVSDLDAGVIFALRATDFTPGTAFSAANVSGFVGQLNLTTGVLTPLVSGFKNPRGRAFVAQ